MDVKLVINHGRAFHVLLPGLLLVGVKNCSFLPAFLKEGKGFFVSVNFWLVLSLYCSVVSYIVLLWFLLFLFVLILLHFLVCFNHVGFLFKNWKGGIKIL